VSEHTQTIRARVLPHVAVEVLESVYQHRLLTTRQVHALHVPGASIRRAQRILTDLARLGLAEHVIGAHRQALWFLTEAGADTVETAGTRAEHRRRVTTPLQAAGPLRSHTLAVNDVGIAFVRAARERGDGCGALSWRHEIAHPITPIRGKHPAQLVIADALLTYAQAMPDESLILHQRFVELDRGTIPTHQLAGKLARYAQLNKYTPTRKAHGAPDGPLWRAYYRSFPAVLVVLAHQTPAAARRRVGRTIALYRSDPERDRYGTVPVSFVTLTDLTANGPFAPIFIDAAHPEQYVNWLAEPRQER
jgi:hypothetical protein